MITLANKEKVGEIVGDGVLKISAIEGCCGYALKTLVVSDEQANIEVDGLKFLIDEETNKIAPELSIDVDEVNNDVLVIKNLAAKSYCGCGRSFSI